MYYVICSLILSHLYYIYVILLCIVRNFTAYYVICALHTASLVLRILRSLYYIWVILLCILRHLCFAYYVICAVHVTGTSEPNYNTEALYKQFKCFFSPIWCTSINARNISTLLCAKFRLFSSLVPLIIFPVSSKFQNWLFVLPTGCIHSSLTIPEKRILQPTMKTDVGYCSSPQILSSFNGGAGRCSGS